MGIALRRTGRSGEEWILVAQDTGCVNSSSVKVWISGHLEGDGKTEVEVIL